MKIMNFKNKLVMKTVGYETSRILVNINLLSKTANNGMVIISKEVNKSLKRKYICLLNHEEMIHIKVFLKYFEKNIKKLFVYANKYDIIKTTIDGYCSKEELSIHYHTRTQEIQILKIKNLFKQIYISLEIIKGLEEIYHIFPEPLLDELNKGISLVLSSLKQIIILVRLDIRGLVEGVNKKHFEYAFDELSSQLYHLKFKPKAILSYIPN